jgi:hypothetical protein
MHAVLVEEKLPTGRTRGGGTGWVNSLLSNRPWASYALLYRDLTSFVSTPVNRVDVPQIRV